ncbi:hypothetical protein EVA_00220 [gut metagenome]|uniref:Uncharacterized protein n=1 Tax=gut metagenome TaxID=749906 RepID=J9H4T6_9ZZZZ
MRIKLYKHFTDSSFHQPMLINRVNIQLRNSKFCQLQFAGWRLKELRLLGRQVQATQREKKAGP